MNGNPLFGRDDPGMQPLPNARKHTTPVRRVDKATLGGAIHENSMGYWMPVFTDMTNSNRFGALASQ